MIPRICLPEGRSFTLIVPAVNSIEFFRDDDATITNNTNPFPWPGNLSIIQKTAPLSNAQLAPALSSSYFAAWPLVPKNTIFATSPPGLVATYPLLVMQASSATDPLIFSNITYTTSTALTPTVGRNVLMQVTNFNDKPQPGTIYLIYNTYDPTQYIFNMQRALRIA